MFSVSTLKLTVFVVTLLMCAIGSKAKCSGESAVTSPACNALRAFHKSSDLRQSVQLFTDVVASNPKDWVCWEYLGGALGMMARRLLNSIGTSQQLDLEKAAMKLLDRAAVAFERAYRFRPVVLTTRAEDIDLYPQLEFAQPLSLVLRGWGDALAWQKKNTEALRVFKLGVHRGIWSEPLCRPEFNFPRRQTAVAKQFVWSGQLVQELFPNTVGKLQDALGDIIEEWNAANKKWQYDPSAETQLWRDESAGLHSGHRWSQMPLMINGELQQPLCSVYFPNLCRLLAATPSFRLRNGQVKFSAMASETVVRPHAGPTNARLRAHCTVQLPPPAAVQEMWMRVGTVSQVWTNGTCFVFDESCEHQVVFRASKQTAEEHRRVVLIVDFANPFLAAEKDFVAAHLDEYRSEARNQFQLKNEDL